MVIETAERTAMEVETKELSMAFVPNLPLQTPPCILPARCMRCSRQLHATTKVDTGRSPRPLSRRAGLQLAALCAVSVALRTPPEIVADADELRAARAELDKMDALIDKARWDTVRTLLAGPVVRGGLQTARAASEAAGPDTRGAWVGLREDALSAAKLLDAAVYSNVFVGEDRRILGTKVDFDTPRSYLAELKDAFDELVGLAEE